MHGQRLRELRKRKDYTLKEVADLLQTSDVNISRWERSTHPPLDAIEKCCSIYNVPLFEFFSNESDFSPSEYTPLIHVLSAMKPKYRKLLLEHFLGLVEACIGSSKNMKE